VPDPVGLSDAQVTRTLTELEAFGEIMNVPAGRLTGILAKARAQMELKPSVGPPNPPAPPLELNP